jgi:hypothetical protein
MGARNVNHNSGLVQGCLVAFICLAAGCTFNAVDLDRVRCDEASIPRTGARCVDGYWVEDHTGFTDTSLVEDSGAGPFLDVSSPDAVMLPDTSSLDPLDVGGPAEDDVRSDDTSVDLDASHDSAVDSDVERDAEVELDTDAEADAEADGDLPDVCEPEDRDAFCARYQATCGELRRPDQCGVPRVEICGVCAGEGEQCIQNACTCVPHTDLYHCDIVDAVCGELEITDRCGDVRTVSCGVCDDPERVCLGNQCVCIGADDATLCHEANAECGELTVVDNCGVERKVDCGTCAGAGVCIEGNTCCTGESQTALCAAMDARCGSHTVTDSCGVSRQISCGGCGSLTTCRQTGSGGYCCRGNVTGVCYN